MRISRSAVLVALVLIPACSEDPPPYGEVPAALQEIEGTGEDAYDRALLSDTAAVAADADKLDKAWKGFRATAIADGAAEADAKALDQAIAGLVAAAAVTPVDAISLARAANAVSGPMDELFALYDPKVPAPVLALDYLGREVALDGLADDPSAATPDIDAIEAGWGALRPQVIDAGGSKQAADYDQSIAAERSAVASGDAEMLVNTANAQLELVDALEKVFDDRIVEDPAD
jgi:hypothetical protein